MRYFVDQTNLAWTRPQMGLLRPLGDQGCQTCEAFEKDASELVAKDRRYAKAPTTLVTVKAVGAPTPEGRRFVKLTVLQERVSIIDRSGKVVDTYPRERLSLTALVLWQGDHWLLYEVVSRPV